MSRILCT